MLTHTFPPLAAVGSFRMGRFARHLPDFGWQPVVVTLRPELFRSVPVDPAQGSRVAESLSVVRTATWDPGVMWRQWRHPAATSRAASEAMANSSAAPINGAAAPSRWRGWLREMYDLARLPVSIPDVHIWWAGPAIRAALAMIREHRPDVLLSSSPPHSVHVIAAIVRRLTGIPWVIDFRDPWRQRKESAVRGRLNGVLEGRCVRAADAVILNTPAMRAQYEAQFPSSLHPKFAVIPNGIDLELAPEVDRLVAEAQQQQQQRTGAVLRIAHVGSVYGKRDLRPLLEAVRLLGASGRNVELELVGPVDGQADLEETLPAQGLAGRVKFFGRVSHAAALRHSAAADVLLVIRNNTPLQVPAKTYEMLLFRKPIVALDDDHGATAGLLRRFGIGEVADPLDATAIAAAITRAETTIRRDHPGWDAARREFDGRRQTGDLAALLDRVAAAAEDRHAHNAASSAPLGEVSWEPQDPYNPSAAENR